jgi:hypothetical protein
MTQCRAGVMGVWSMALPGSEPVTSPLVGWAVGTAAAREGFGLAGVTLILAAGSSWPASAAAAFGAAV